MNKQLAMRLPFFVLLLTGMLQAQTPFWTQDFSNGIPANWTNVDASGQNVIWTWCNDPAAGNNQAGCPSVWNDDTNFQIPFQATTATNGFVTLDSDEYGDVNPNHISQLTTNSINCASFSEVFLSFQTHIGVYTIDADIGAIVRVSTDKIVWTEYVVFPGLTTLERWSANPEEPIIDISDVAAGKPAVYIQWQWIGTFEYHWSIDDIALYDKNPTPPHDLAIGDFYFPPSSQYQPVSQIATDTFGFSADLSNRGTLAQTNILLKVAVTTNTNELLFSDSTIIPALAPGVKDSTFQLAKRFIPNLPVGEYRIKYMVSADSVDLRPNNNEVESAFFVTGALFAKEGSPEQGYQPDSPGDWYVGNLYQMSNGNQEQYKATLAEIAFTTDPDSLPISAVEATIYLFRVADNVALDFLNFDNSAFFSTDLVWVGVGAHMPSDTVQDFELQAIDLFDISTNAPGVVLENGARYILAVGYSGPSSQVFHAFNDDVDMYFVSTLTYSDRWYIYGFGSDVNAVARMTISLVSAADQRPLPESSMTIFPNPIHETLNLAVQFDQPTDATITLADLSGRVLEIRDQKDLTNNTLSFRLNHLASGTYLARIATAEGTLTKKFVVQK